MAHFESKELSANIDMSFNRMVCISSDEDYEWMKRYMRSIYFTNMFIKRVKNKHLLYLN